MEQWKDVPSWEGWYQVSDEGRVRSLTRRSNCGKSTAIYKGRILKTGLLEAGYDTVVLSQPGRRAHTYVHRLVAAAFIGPCPPKLEVCHNNGKRTDNRLENLRYDTRQNNAFDRLKHGTMPTGVAVRGEDNASAILTDAAVITIRAIEGKTLQQIAGRYGVSISTISLVRNRKIWRHI